MADPAGEVDAVLPVVEDYRRHPLFFGIIIDDHPAVLGRQRSLFLHPGFSQQNTSLNSGPVCFLLRIDQSLCRALSGARHEKENNPAD